MIITLSILLVVTVSSCKKEDLHEKNSEEEMLDSIQYHTFKYFWDFANQTSGLIRDRSTGNDNVSIGATGFGFMAIIAGIERSFISRQEGTERTLKMLRFLNKNTTRYHGAWSHLVSGYNGITIPFATMDDGADIVETAYLVQGMLTSKTYFDQENTEESEIRKLVDSLWLEVDWDWFTKGEDQLYWHWSPNYGFALKLPVRGFNETQITYILALASPTHPISLETYENGWAGTDYSYLVDPENADNSGGPLFFTHYSYLGLSPYFSDKFLSETQYSSYFERNKRQVELNCNWCLRRNLRYIYYSDSCWGLTASDDPIAVYLAHEPTVPNDNGTISPTAAISSIIYTPEICLKTIKNFCYIADTLTIWGKYGFVDAFNIDKNWTSNSYIGIDQGPILIMIENYRTGLLWKYFMKNQEIQHAQELIGN